MKASNAEVQHLANHVDHHDDIHRNIYRLLILAVEILKVFHLLESDQCRDNTKCKILTTLFLTFPDSVHRTAITRNPLSQEEKDKVVEL